MVPVTRLLILVLFAGCMAPDPGVPDPTEAPTMTPPVDTPAPELPSASDAVWEDCRLIVVSGLVPVDQVEPHVPEPYEPDTVAPGMTELALRVYLCDGIVFDNTTLVQDAALAFLTVVARTPADVDETGHSEAYVLDAWSASSLIQDRFNQEDFAMQEAGISAEATETGLEVQIEAADHFVSFEAPVAVARMEAPSPGTYRFFHTAPEVSWLRQDLSFNETLPFILEPGLLEYEGGTLAKIMGAGPHAWVASDNLVSGGSRFEEQ